MTVVISNVKGKKYYCGDKVLEKVRWCICESGYFKKDKVVTPYQIEKKCGIDHNQAKVCLEILEEIGEGGKVCEKRVNGYINPQPGWELVKINGWKIDPPATYCVERSFLTYNRLSFHPVLEEVSSYSEGILEKLKSFFSNLLNVILNLLSFLRYCSKVL
jgi:hypothetical protein